MGCDTGGHGRSAIEAGSKHFDEQRTFGSKERAFVEKTYVGNDAVPLDIALSCVRVGELDPHVRVLSTTPRGAQRLQGVASRQTVLAQAVLQPLRQRHQCLCALLRAEVRENLCNPHSTLLTEPHARDVATTRTSVSGVPEVRLVAELAGTPELFL